MIRENSGLIYKIPLNFDRGCMYGEVMDYTDISDFSGLLIRIFKYRDSDRSLSTNIKAIVNSGIFFGPVPVNKMPNKKGKGAWKLTGKSEDVMPEAGSLYFKDLRGNIM